MILVDTSIWIDHLRASEPVLVEMLDQGLVVTHPLVIGELALGAIARRAEFLGYLKDLPTLGTVSHAELLIFIDAHALFGRGICLVDAHLLAAARIVAGTSVWTGDRRLAAAAQELGVRADSS